MKAAVVKEPGHLVVEDVPDPKLGPYEVLCRQLYGATCVGTDLHIIHNQFPWPVKYPTLLGHESVGRVVQAGEKVRHFKIGDVISRVCNLKLGADNLSSTWGGFAEYGVARDHRAMKEDGCPDSEWRSSRVNQVIPPDIDPAEATMMITWRETFSFISRMGVTRDRSLLVVGSGGNGLAFVAHAKNIGATNIAMIGSGERAELGRKLGASKYYSYSNTAVDTAIKQDFAAGFDFIIDAIGRVSSLDDALPHAAVAATVTNYGLDDFGKWRLNPSRARGTFTYYNGGYDEAETHDAILNFMRTGKLNARNWLTGQPYALDQIVSAYDAVKSRREIKALVKLS